MRYLRMCVLVFPIVNCHATEPMEVAICNPASLARHMVEEAEKEASFVFQSALIDVTWSPCERAVGPRQPGGPPRFVIRLRSDHAPRQPGALSLHAMGLAFVSGPGNGYLADVYSPAVGDFAKTSQTREGWLVGYTMAHELGHLLLGPGHRPHGIMRATWSLEETRALEQRSLRFDKYDSVRMQQILHALRAAAR